MALITSGTAYVDTVAGTNDSSHGGSSGSGACLTLAYLVAYRLGTLTGPLVVDCHGSTADTVQPDIGDTAISTTATNTLTIRANAADRAVPGWDANKYRLSVTGTLLCRIREGYVNFDGVQFELIPTGAANFFTDTARSSSGISVFSGCVFKGDGGSAYQCREIGGAATRYYINCLVYNLGTHGNSYLAFGYGANYLYNCTVVGAASGPDCVVRNDGATSVECKNTYAGRTSGSGACFYGTLAGDYNASSDTSADTKFGTGINSVAVNTTNFVDVTVDGGEDFHLPVGTGSALYDVGNAPGGSAPLNYTTDIDGDTVATWCIGVDSRPAAATFVPYPLSSRARGGLLVLNGGLQ